MRESLRSTVFSASVLSSAAGAASLAAGLELIAPALGLEGRVGEWAVAAACCTAATAVSAVLFAFSSIKNRGPVKAAAAEAADKTADDAQSGIVDDFTSAGEALVRETKMALKMQRRIVPRQEELPARPELAFGTVYIPAGNTGGDIYDAVRAGKNGYAFLVADVSGRGVPAALVSAMVKNSFRSKASWHADPAEVVGSVNRELVPILAESDNFVTAFYAVLDLENGFLSYANAGHPPAFLVRRRLSSIDNLDSDGGPLGISAEQTYVVGQRRLEEGDRLVFFTDGVSGARNFRGEEFSRERLAAFIRAGMRLPVTELAAALSEELRNFSIGAPPGDDTVLMICEFRSFAKPPAEAAPSIRGDDYPSLSRKGAYLASNGRLEEAVRVYERLLSLEPEDAMALSNLGTLYWKLGRKEEAALRFREAARINPRDPRIARNLALAERFAAGKKAGSSISTAEANDEKASSAMANNKVQSIDSLAALESREGIDDVEDAEPVAE
jgi:serine phosphatase RsbU (regulator of sigma subunit)